MQCRCEAKLNACDYHNALCPASTRRLIYDTEAAMIELHAAAEEDKADEKEQEEE